jgi:protein-S-isoprenylcysteine O-methyltransferase Ste14
MLLKHLLLIILWLFFSLFHSIFAGEGFKKFMQHLMKKKYKYYRMLYSIFASISLAVILLYQVTITSVMLWKVPLIEMIFAGAGLISGAGIMAIFIKNFFFELSGVDVFRSVKNSNNLFHSGLYKHVRHPLYAATLLFIWSIFFLYPSMDNLISSLCITIYTLIGIHFEEKKLIKAFGSSYIQYRLITPMIIPKFYKIKQ